MVFNDKEAKILNEFSFDYNRRVYGRDIARKLRMNQKTVSNILNKLEKKHILKYTEEGKNKYYYINKFNPNIKEIIKLIELNKKINFLEKYNKLKELFDKIVERSNRIVIIFGSYANFTATEKSDLDIFTTGKTSDLEDLEEIYNIKINVIKSDKSKFNASEVIVKEIIKNHVILKGIEEFVELVWLV